MNLICHDARTVKHLRKWAGSLSLTVLVFELRPTHSAMQRSVEGLLRSFIAEILTRHPGSLPTIESLVPGTYGDGWTEENLGLFLQKLIGMLESTTRICVFLDGLEEASGNRDGFLSLLKPVTQGSGFKMCLTRCIEESSFGNKSITVFEVADITKQAVSEAVVATLRLCPQIAQLELGQRAWLSQLQSTLSERANGSFVWVEHLTNRSFNHISDDDDLVTVERKLLDFPQSLNQVYLNMLTRIKSSEAEAAECFQLARHLQEHQFVSYKLFPSIFNFVLGLCGVDGASFPLSCILLVFFRIQTQTQKTRQV